MISQENISFSDRTPLREVSALVFFFFGAVIKNTFEIVKNLCTIWEKIKNCVLSTAVCVTLQQIIGDVDSNLVA
jgi:hypothetical protein